MWKNIMRKPLVACSVNLLEVKWSLWLIYLDCEIDTDIEHNTVREPEDSQECGDVFDNVDDIRTHVEKHHEGLKSCMIFGVPRVSEPEEETCKECGDVQDTLDDMRTHVEKYHEGLASFCDGVEQSESEPKETCRECSDVLDTVNDVKTHVIFVMAAQLQSHVERYHEHYDHECQEEVLEVLKKGEKNQQDDGTEDISLEQGLGCQSEAGAMEEPYTCERCDNYFATYADLENHVETHAGSECCRFFPFRECMDDADAEHEVNKPADTCKACGKSFETEVTFKEHFTDHSHSLVILGELSGGSVRTRYWCVRGEWTCGGAGWVGQEGHLGEGGWGECEDRHAGCEGGFSLGGHYDWRGRAVHGDWEGGEWCGRGLAGWV